MSPGGEIILKHALSMKTQKFLPVLAAAAATLFCVSTASAADLPTVSVARTESGGVAAWQPAMGDGLAQMMITELSKLPNMKVLESVALEDLREERRLGESGEVSEKESVKKGAWLGADYTLVTKVTRFGAKESKFGGGGIGIPIPGGGRFKVGSSEHEVQIDWRLSDNTTRAIVKADRSVGLESGKSFNFSTIIGGGFSESQEFMDSALGKATMKAIADIVSKLREMQLAPGARSQAIAAAAAGESKAQEAAKSALRKTKGTVKMVEGKDIWVSLGANHQFAKGDKVKIYKPIEKKNKKGEVVATVYELAGEISLTKVQKEQSLGRYDGSAAIEEGWVALDPSVDTDELE